LVYPGAASFSATEDGSGMAELLGMLLDLADALAGAVGIAYWWCTWVSPRHPHPNARRSEGPEIERFVGEVRACPDSRKVCP
jgi:hypothetical protein